MGGGHSHIEKNKSPNKSSHVNQSEGHELDTVQPIKPSEHNNTLNNEISSTCEIECPSFTHLNPSDFTILNHIRGGSMGKVYSAKRNSDSCMVALKFFGYTNRDPSARDVYSELGVMSALKGVDGVVNMYGAFLDTDSGLVSGKVFLKSYPVIVMELLRGGELFDRMHDRKSISEKDLALMFKNIIHALDSLHRHHYVHRDLKLENLMFVDDRDDSPIKIVDFGTVVGVPDSDDGVYRDSSVVGTPGYIAPESIQYFDYSRASDMWQAGCTLYSMLSGLPPFNPQDMQQITHRKYFKMEGVGWDEISVNAKDLVSRLLRRSPKYRPTSEEVLQHPWIVSEAPDADLGPAYIKRIKHLALRQKMKSFFVENNIELGNQDRREKLIATLPFLRENRHSPKKSMSENMVFEKGSAGGFQNDDVADDDQFETRLKRFSGTLVKSLSMPQEMRNSCTVDSGEVTVDSIPTGRVGYDTFSSVLGKSDLCELASPQVFSIFDVQNTGTVDMKEFLLTMVALRQPLEEGEEGDSTSFRFDGASVDSESTATARMYFDIFDINGSGFIDVDELKVAIGCFLQDESNPLYRNAEQYVESMANIQSLFDEIDSSRDGKIEFSEFQTFYKSLLVNSTMNAAQISTALKTKS